MNIAFWSNANELCQVSANMAAISMASIVRYPYSVIIMENQLNNHRLERAFFGEGSIDFIHEVGTNYYDGGGMEGLIRKIYRGECSGNIIRHYLKEIISQRLYYIPQSRIIHSEIFDYELDHCIHKLLGLINKESDICFIETASHRNLSTKTILEEADLIVVNLCQKQCILEDFFLNYSILSEKAIFLVSNIDQHSKVSARSIANCYDIPNDNIIVIPYCENFLSACTNGNIKDFICANYTCQKENPNFFLMQAIKKATYLIIKKAVEQAKEKELLCLR